MQSPLHPVYFHLVPKQLRHCKGSLHLSAWAPGCDEARSPSLGAIPPGGNSFPCLCPPVLDSKTQTGQKKAGPAGTSRDLGRHGAGDRGLCSSSQPTKGREAGTGLRPKAGEDGDTRTISLRGANCSPSQLSTLSKFHTSGAPNFFFGGVFSPDGHSNPHPLVVLAPTSSWELLVRFITSTGVYSGCPRTFRH